LKIFCDNGANYIIFLLVKQKGTKRAREREGKRERNKEREKGRRRWSKRK
jgi:hypothetical protein